MIQTPFFEGRVNRTKRRKSTRERAARHWRRERGLLRGLSRRRRLIGRGRGGPLARDLGRLGRRWRGGGAALFLRGGVGVRSRRGGGLLALGFRATLRFRFFRRRRSCGGSLCVRVVDLLAGASVEILRHALLKAGHAFGEHRLAGTGQLLLGIEEVEQ